MGLRGPGARPKARRPLYSTEAPAAEWSRHRPLEGYRVGRLTVMEHVGKNEQGAHLWRCECDCGGEKVSSSVLLVRRKVKSCGCYKRGPKRWEDKIY
jgi:hypothetical protein